MSRKKTALEKKSAKPLHDQIYEAIRNDLLAGVYRTGQKMPITPKLLTRYKVNSSTLQRAMNRLVKEGYVERSPRRGTFVKHKPHGARIAVFTEENLLHPQADFGRLLVQQLKDSAVSFGWSLEIFDSVGQSSPAHIKQISERYSQAYQQHPFRGLIEINVNTLAKGIIKPADNLYSAGIGPQAGANGVDLDFAHMASSCMAEFAKVNVKQVFSLRSKGGLPLGTKEKNVLKKEAKNSGLKITFIDVNPKDAHGDPAAAAYHHAALALKSSKNIGFLCNEHNTAQGIAEASVKASATPPVILVSADCEASSHLIPVSVYCFAAADIADSIMNRLDEQMHANGVEAPTPTQGKLISSVVVSKSPPEKVLKKSWKA